MSNAEHIQEIKLYGVNHGFGVSTYFGGTTYYDVAPPDDFLDHFSIGPENLVGIEATHEMGQYASKHEEPDFRFWDLGSDRFFRLACKTLKDNDIPTAYLDDVRLTRRVMPKVASLVAQISCLERNGDDFLSDRNVHRKGLFGSLLPLINILKEPIMFDNMAMIKPDVVVLGQAHADILAANPSLQRRYGVEVTGYAHILPKVRQSVSQDSAAGFEHYERVVPSYIYIPSDAEVQQLADDHSRTEEQVRRQFNAFSIGRVLGRKEAPPDYLGRFYTINSAADSLFELSITERQGKSFTGEIKDVLGDAVAEGEIGNKGIEFSKKYTRVLDGRNLPSWVYRGNLDKATGMVTGRYDQDHNSARRGSCFVMAPFSEFPRRSTIKRLDNRDEWDPEDRDVFKIAD